MTALPRGDRVGQGRGGRGICPCDLRWRLVDWQQPDQQDDGTMPKDQTTAPSMYCPKCGYQLIGLSENRCPECGRAFEPADAHCNVEPGHVAMIWMDQ
jgi:hypothetical protein